MQARCVIMSLTDADASTDVHRRSFLDHPLTSSHIAPGGMDPYAKPPSTLADPVLLKHWSMLPLGARKEYHDAADDPLTEPDMEIDPDLQRISQVKGKQVKGRTQQSNNRPRAAVIADSNAMGSGESAVFSFMRDSLYARSGARPSGISIPEPRSEIPVVDRERITAVPQQGRQM